MSHNPQHYIRHLDEHAINYDLVITNPKSDRWLVAVHGINREFDTLLRWFTEPAQVQGYNLLAPVFAQVNYDDYQRLGRRGRGRRADLALLACLDDARALGFKLPAQVPLFGFSGGAQFAHRFALAHGQHVSALICAAAGWYTPLHSERRFPYGLAPTKRLKNQRFSAQHLLAMPTMTLVGEKDNEMDDAVRDHPVLNAEQGTSRLARAQWWQKHLNQHAKQINRHLLQVMPDCDHDLHRCALVGELPLRTFAFLNLVEHSRPSETHLKESTQ